MVIHYGALSVQTAQTDARIAALLLHTCQLRWALGIDGALWSAIRRQTDVIFDARTRGTVTSHLTLGVGTTGRWQTRIRRRWRRFCNRAHVRR